MKAKDIRAKFGTTESELTKVYAEIERLGERYKLLYWHEFLSYSAQKRLKKDGFKIESGDNCLIISW